MFGQPYLYSSDSLYILRLTGETVVLYGICVVKYELLEVTY